MPKRAQPHDTAQSDDLQGLDILVVEDSRAVGDALKGLLELLVPMLVRHRP
jgi:hypothetical protein